jgi:hypothetical protein
LIFSASRAVAATRAAVSSSAAGSRCAGVVFAAAGFAAPMTAPERVKRAAFFLPPRAMIFALFLTPRAIWTQKEVKDWEGLFTKRKKFSQWCEPDEHTCLLRALACKTGCVS